MPFTYNINHTQKQVMVNRTGVLTLESVLTSMADIQKDPEWDPTYDTLADCSEITEVDMDPDDIQSLVVSLSQEDIGKGRVALVVGYDVVNFALGEYFEQLTTHHDMAVHKVFRSRDEAEAWLASKR